MSASAEDHGAPPPAEGHGGGEGGGEHEAKAKEGESKAPPEWLALQNDLNTLKAKIKGKQDSIVKLIEEKKHSPDSHLKEITHSLSSEYKELEKLNEEYEKKRTVLMFRYPERGKDPDRKYNRMKLKSLEEMEAQAGIDSQLDQNMELMKKQFPKRKQVVEPKAVEAPLPAKGTSVDSETIILSK